MDEPAENRLWDLLNDADDYFAGGYRKPHASPLRPGPVRDPRTAAPTAAHNDGAAVAARPAAEPIETGPDLDPAERKRRLAELSARVSSCTQCKLHETRKNAVPGTGVIDPLVMVIGEGPGADEDASGLPFVGRAGQYLDKWLDAIDLSRHKNAYIANIVKCRPPNNRDPQPEESDACFPFLLEQIALVRPKIILTVGRVASQILIGRFEGISSLRGKVYQFAGLPLVPTYHPSGVLRNPDYRRPVWEDMKLLRSIFPK
ncbi:MAG TPA: uracil-DNA glycosylase [Spirochaetia bacterium]|nr:uracil-DNA glycosylase [Spirochaetia bacterium]